MSTESSILASRAVHSYRRRDIFAYVSLRHYLRNTSALNDEWSREVATEITIDRREPFFHIVENFKEVVEKTGEAVFRTLHVPGPNEIMAETALLAACAEAGGFFARHPSVYSYILAEGNDRSGVFLPYFDGFRARHAAIAEACRAQPGASVVYTDIKQFYPSIAVDLALRVWRHAAENSNLPVKYAELGAKLLQNARRFQSGAKSNDDVIGILTGPMISHLIGNLVLRVIDDDMARQLPNGYFRYVDDVAIVAPPDRALEIEQRLKLNLQHLGFHLNDQKRLETPADKWLLSADDFENPSGISWMTFIGDMKRLLLLYPDTIYALRTAFSQIGVRIRPLDYSEVSHERGYLERLQQLMKFRWFRQSVRKRLGVGELLTQCDFLRTHLLTELRTLLSTFERLRDYERKRKLYRLKFLVARMLYLGSKEELAEISAGISGIIEMAMAAAVYDAVISRNVSQLLRYGPSAAQAAAQALRADGEIVFCSAVDWTKPWVIQSCAVFQLNGLTVQSDSVIPDAAALRFSRWSDKSFSLFHSNDPYFRELSCLHGMDDPDANRRAIETAFDRDDDLVFDIQETMHAYPY